MDGDLVLIKLVKNRPVLWNKSVRTKQNSNGKDLAWTTIAGKIGADCEWIKNRWYNLQERFFNALKAKDYKTPLKFKYYDEMIFLTTQIDIKKEPGKLHRRPEFVITKRDIEEFGDDEIGGDEIFEEIVSENDSLENDQSSSDLIARIFDEEAVEEECDSIESKMEAANENVGKRSRPSETENGEVEIPSKMIRIDEIVQRKIKQEPDSDIVSTSTVEEVMGEKEPKPIEPPEPHEKSNNRCEDAIFGELVTAMLKGMPEMKKKQVKKEIMNILLS